MTADVSSPTPEVSLDDALDLDGWSGPDALQAASARLGRDLADAFAEEASDHTTIRRELLPKIDEIRAESRAVDAGLYRVTGTQIALAQRALLHNGAAATGCVAAHHDSARLGVAQIGVCLTSYDGSNRSGSYGIQMFRRDQPLPSDPLRQAFGLLESRARQDRSDAGETSLAELAKRGIRAWAERAILLEKTDVVWRFGRGPFTPFELLSGGGYPEVLRAGLDVLTRFAQTCKTFAFVGTPGRDKVMETIGGGLRPGEFALLVHDVARCKQMVERTNLAAAERNRVDRYIEEVAPRITCGVYRVCAADRPQVFWAHADHAKSAALALMADALQRSGSNRPLLPDLAQVTAQTAFAADGLEASVTAAQVASGRAFG
ncbi:MAG: hypothetical protein AAF743_08335 [Planctomycetota bacterium]